MRFEEAGAGTANPALCELPDGTVRARAPCRKTTSPPGRSTLY
jgi:hypothetical protein